jgi:pimeloyl-ACP methyl ester carboxylesterase/DNA-binding CsgD family transcriptional regulator
MIADRARRGATLGEAMARLWGAWPASGVAPTEVSAIQRVVDSIHGFDLDNIPVVTAPAPALAFAVVDKSGEIRCRDPGFAELPTDSGESESVSRLLRRARRGDSAVGLAETRSGEVVALCGASPENALAWPLSDALRAALEHASEPVVLMSFSPTLASGVALGAVSAFGLSALEARVAVALLEAPTLDIAASRVGVGRETARDALAGAKRKMGVSRTPMLVHRLTDLICGMSFLDEGDPLIDALDLTLGEARVARLSAEGASTATVARALGVKPATIKSHLRSAFSKAGVTRAKDLGRLDTELRALGALAQAREFVTRVEEKEGKLRMIARPDGRRVAFMDYGPTSGRLLFVCHALASGRTLPPGLAARLRCAGFRPVVPQRPGFGLTDPAVGDYLSACADDMAAILHALKRDTADIFARDIATAALLAFAEAYPERVGRVVLLNPELQVRARPRSRSYAIPAAARLLQRHPELTAPFFELMRRQTGTERLAALLTESFKSGAPSDFKGLQDPEGLDWMVRDIQAMVARSISGIVQERLVYARGWSPPSKVGGRSWTIAQCAELGSSSPQPWWSTLPDFRFELIATGGLQLTMTHPETIVGLLVRDDGELGRLD